MYVLMYLILVGVMYLLPMYLSLRPPVNSVLAIGTRFTCHSLSVKEELFNHIRHTRVDPEDYSSIDNKGQITEIIWIIIKKIVIQ